MRWHAVEDVNCQMIFEVKEQTNASDFQNGIQLLLNCVQKSHFESVPTIYNIRHVYYYVNLENCFCERNVAKYSLLYQYENIDIKIAEGKKSLKKTEIKRV